MKTTREMREKYFGKLARAIIAFEDAITRRERLWNSDWNANVPSHEQLKSNVDAARNEVFGETVAIVQRLQLEMIAMKSREMSHADSRVMIERMRQ
jgi:hypothetical protein